MNEITSIKLPIAIDWESKRREVEQHISLLDPMFEEHRDLRLFYTGALAEVYPERFIHAQREAAEYWTPYLTGDKPLTDFFKDWLTFTPYPENPGKYIVFWDILVKNWPTTQSSSPGSVHFSLIMAIGSTAQSLLIPSRSGSKTRALRHTPSILKITKCRKVASSHLTSFFCGT